MRSLFLMRYKMTRSPLVSLMAVYAVSYQEAASAFDFRMWNKRIEREQYQLLSHRQILEEMVHLQIHLDFIRKLPDDQLCEFLRDRKARQLADKQSVERTVLDLLEQLEPIRN
ncbi:hypothetical protein [Blastopirellula marina]|uniref:Uncharacterized protein n=1 Tax=Blastopirellula marina DSM 3645 TaxID=314230 RepID=A3ZPR3_9BACT|nr:hypothetical protein [Blastopirellula marina]EAQ81741.1 hypothetical protein DSM3645_29207 [Blastopirellula marina DSM 3645]